MKLLLTSFSILTIIAIFSCHKTKEEDRIIVDPLPPITMYWKGQQWYVGAQGSGFIKPDSTTVLALFVDKSYKVLGEKSVHQSGTYKFDTTRTPITGGAILIDTFLVLTPGPALSKDVTLGDRLHVHYSNDSIILNSIITPGGYNINYFRLNP